MIKQDSAFLLLAAFFLTSAFAEESMTPAELEKWFYEDEPIPSIQVDEGELVFLEKMPDKPVLHSINELTIDAASVDNGWVKLKQCYKNLDQVSEADIVYNYRFMRNLKIASTLNIGSAQARDQLITLRDVEENAEICVSAEVRVFYQNKDESYSLINGPYHRKFLDGYFPYHVTLVINYPEKILRHVSSQPDAQDGLRIIKESDKLSIDAVFAGTLNTEIIFRKNQ